jgi:hypothetical protein
MDAAIKAAWGQAQERAWHPFVRSTVSIVGALALSTSAIGRRGRLTLTPPHGQGGLGAAAAGGRGRQSSAGRSLSRISAAAGQVSLRR